MGINFHFTQYSWLDLNTVILTHDRVATVREKSLENEIFFRSGKSQGIPILVMEI